MRTPLFSSLMCLLAGAIGALASQNPLTAQSLRYSGSLGFSAGAYTFTDRTESLALLSGLSFSSGRISLTATLPIISQNSGDVAFIGGGLMPTGGPGHEGSMGGHSGNGMGVGGSEPANPTGEGHGSFETTIGDPLFRSSVRLHNGVGTLRSVSAEVYLKAPVAPVSSGIGTGAWDVGVGSTSVLALGGTIVLAGVSFWSPGDLPDLVLKEYLGFSFGVGRLLGRRWSLLSSVNLATTVLETIDPPASAGLSFGFRPSRGRSLSGGFNVGLTEASPDFTVFLGWSLGFLSPETGGLPQGGINRGL